MLCVSKRRNFLITFLDCARNDIFILCVADVSCLVIQDGCVGLPRLVALECNDESAFCQSYENG